VLDDAAGAEVARIQERSSASVTSSPSNANGDTPVTVRKALVGIRDRFAIDIKHGAPI
jgi:hypothetical protein